MDVRILIVADGNNTEWEKTAASLGKAGFSVSTAAAPPEALKCIRNEQVNIVLVDYLLPRLKPLSFLDRVKSLRPHIEIIFLSEKVSLAKATEAMKAGAYDFYELPVAPKLLVTVIGKAIEKQSLFFEKAELERKVKARFDFSRIVGRSKAMQHVINIVSSVAPKNVNILLTGETGTGKEMIAHAVHYNSSRAGHPFITVNCAAYNEGVLESELFGHEKGAFTGAITKRVGRFEVANGGTIFLDEIGDVALSTQIKLLRVLQEREFERVGGNETIKVDVRVIAATNQNLQRLMESGRFREDLYYRLNVVHIEVPPLRDRKEDIPLLVSSFLLKLNTEKGYHMKGISKESMQVLLNYRWPGNVRELENALESAMALSERTIIEAKYLPAFLLLTQPQNNDYYQVPRDLTLADMEREIVRLTLERTGGNKSAAARMLRMGLRTLQRKTKLL